MSGIDIIDGTPVLDIKPYIPEYDSPPSEAQSAFDSDRSSRVDHMDNTISMYTEAERRSAEDAPVPETGQSVDASIDPSVDQSVCQSIDGEVGRSGDESIYQSVDQSFNRSSKSLGQSVHRSVSESVDGQLDQSVDSTTDRSVAEWIREKPALAHVRFTAMALRQVAAFSRQAPPPYKLALLADSSQLTRAIEDILRADPRSVYRRQKCSDRLYYFSVDGAHVTAWFDDDENVAEVVRVKPLDVNESS